MNLRQEIEKLIDIALKEDLGSGDLTTQVCIPEHAELSGKFILKQAGVLAGLPFLETVFKQLDPKVTVNLLVEEGSFQTAGTVIAKIHGPARAILSGERVALNLLKHASGVATSTAAYVKKVRKQCLILDTRKTLPGLRALEKYAVQTGGGQIHRFGLDDRIVIKNKHLAFVSLTSRQPIKQAVATLKKANPNLPIEVEIKDPKQLEEALQTEVYAIMLTNMSTEDAKKCVDKIRKTNKKVYIEAGGAITLDTVRAYAETGVDGISVGDLMDPVNLDIGMRFS